MVTVAALQDLSQARNRWGRQAEGFLSLFGDKLILPEIADHETLELVSLLVGDYDRRMVVYSSSQNLGLGHWGGSEGTTVSYTRERILPPSAIYQGNGPGEALYLQGRNWTPVYLTPYHYAPPRPQLGEGPVLYSPQYIVLATRADHEGPVEIEVRVDAGEQRPAGHLLFDGELLTAGQGVLIGNSLTELYHVPLPIGWYPVRIYADQPTNPSRFTIMFERNHGPKTPS